MTAIAPLPTSSGQAAAVRAVRTRLAKAAKQVAGQPALARELLAIAVAMEELEAGPERAPTYPVARC